MATELTTIVDFIRWGASRFNGAGLSFGHGHDSAIDEASQLVLHALHLPPDTPPVYGQSHLTQDEKVAILGLFQRRIDERMPAAYLTGEAWFAGLAFKVDRRVLVPRSPIGELIPTGFEPWIRGRDVRRALDLCTGSGCIAIAMAHHQPHWRVDAGDLSADAIDLARENAARLDVAERCRFVVSDLFDGFAGQRYDLIVSNPPYVPDAEVAKLPAEYGFEPAFGLAAGADGLDFALRILAEAADHLTPDGVLVLEVGDSERALAEMFPHVPFAWIEFKVGPMGVFVLERAALLEHREAFAAEAARRRR